MAGTLLTRRHVLAAPLAAALPRPAFAEAEETSETWVIPEKFMPRAVRFRDEQVAGSIIVDPNRFALYWVTAPKKGMRYTVGVGRGNLYESGSFTVGAKKEWPSWTPTKEMIARNPGQYGRYADGMPGGPTNPLGARALYLFDAAGADTFLRIHGTPEPWTINSAVSNGCVRLTNEHIVELYDEVTIGAPVLLLPKAEAA
jgi:lipoprotein-anchoring transpeptidase ErfK/SrfK